MTATTFTTVKNESEKASLYLYAVTKTPAGEVETEVRTLTPGESLTKEGREDGVVRIKAEDNGTKVTIIEFETVGSHSVTRYGTEVKGVKFGGSFSTHFS